jgi:hypothetical protein
MKKILFYTLILLLLAPVATKAQDTYKLLQPLPCISGDVGCKEGETKTDIDLNSYIGYVYKFAIAIAVFIAIVMIVYGGFEYMMSDSVTSKSDAKSKFKSAATGLLMVLASYLILQTIDPRLVGLNTSIPKLKITTSTTNNLGDLSDEALNNLSIEDKKRIDEIDSKIKNLQEMKALAQENGASQEDLDKFDAKITALTREKLAIEITSKNNSIQEFNKIIQNINNRTGSVDLASLNSSMDSAYNLLTANRDYEGASSIMRQKNFYNEEVPRQQNLSDAISGYKTAMGPLGSTLTEIYYKNQLNNLLDLYKKEVINPQYKNDPNIVKIYNGLKEDRINLIKNALNITN